MQDPKNSSQAAAGPGARATDLPEEMTRRIDAMTERLGTIDHYTLLGLPRSATRAQVRSAFLGVAPQFHPDKYFGKNLGDYKAKMQRVFAQLSIAHDTLVKDETRADYDRRLPPPLPGMPLPAPHTPAPPSPPPVSGTNATGPNDFGSASMRSAAPSSPEMERARQQAFARRLAGSPNRIRAATPMPGSQRPVTPGPIPPAGAQPIRRSSMGMPAVDPAAAVDALRRRYQESKAQAISKQSSSHVQAAEAALAKGNFAEAARLYRVALENSSDPSLRAVLADTESKAKTQDHATAVAAARESEQKQDFGDAGNQWARAFDLLPSAETANRAAMCMRRAGVDARRAAKYGEEAVKLDPNKATYRATLALLYADAGLTLRARGEIERAVKLDPQNSLVKDAAARLKGMK